VTSSVRTVGRTRQIQAPTETDTDTILGWVDSGMDFEGMLNMCDTYREPIRSRLLGAVAFWAMKLEDLDANT
jgi:hypothetical protein